MTREQHLGSGKSAHDEAVLERDAELTRIDNLIASGAAGDGQLVVVEGAAGIGKTRLLDVASDRANRKGINVLTAVAGELEGDVTFAVVRELFERIMASTPAEERDRLVAGAARFAAPVVDPTAARGAIPVGGHGGGAALHGLYWLVANLAERAPVLLVVDDAHWADASSGAWLLYMARRLQDLAVTLLLGVRSGEPLAGWLSRLIALPAASLVEPAPLSPAGTARLARATLGVRADDAVCAACHRVTGGNPFLVVELAAALAAEGTPLTASGVAALSPATVARSVASRLARLGLPAGRLARAVAVLGAGPRLDHAAALAGLDASVAAEAADALVSGGILEPVELSFAHPMLRTSVYTESAPAWRAQAHGIAARLLAAEGATPAAVAAHIMRANTAADPAVVEVLRDAAAEAIDAGAPDTAATFLRRALGEPPSPEQHGQVLYELGLAELVGGDPGAIEHLATALRATSDRPRRARIALALGRAQVGAGSLADADSTLSQAIGEAGDAELVARIETYRCVLGIWSPQFAPTVGARLAELRSLAEGDGPAAHGLLLALAFRAAFNGEPRTEIMAMVDRGLSEIQAEAGNITDPVAWAVRSLTFVDALDRADGVVADMFAHAQRASSAPTFASALVCRAAVAVRRGQIAAAEDDARRAVEIVVTHQLGFLAPQAHAWLGEALLERGELDEAAAVLEGADLTAMRGSRPEALFLHVRGRARLGRGERAAGLADLRLCRSIQEAVGLANPNVIPWLSTLALALPHGELKEAHALVETELNQALAIGQPRAIGVALRAKALLADHDSAIPLLREAVHVLEASPSQIEHARALTDLGAALRRANQRAAARAPLRQALDLATRCAATALAVRARDELVATGARPRRTVLVGADALTPTERRVAAMAAAGRSNRDIAEALFVSMKTVATHLGHAYQKLDITAREQLATAVLASPDQATPR